MTVLWQEVLKATVQNINIGPKLTAGSCAHTYVQYICSVQNHNCEGGVFFLRVHNKYMSSCCLGISGHYTKSQLAKQTTEKTHV